VIYHLLLSVALGEKEPMKQSIKDLVVEVQTQIKLNSQLLSRRTKSIVIQFQIYDVLRIRVKPSLRLPSAHGCGLALMGVAWRRKKTKASKASVVFGRQFVRLLLQGISLGQDWYPPSFGWYTTQF